MEMVEGDTHSKTSSETETDKSSKNNDEESFNDENDIDDFPAITHSVIFKCIGVFKDHRYQEMLSLVAKKLREGGEVPVRLQKEPKNPSRFLCNTV